MAIHFLLPPFPLSNRTICIEYNPTPKAVSLPHPLTHPSSHPLSKSACNLLILPHSQALSSRQDTGSTGNIQSRNFSKDLATLQATMANLATSQSHTIKLDQILSTPLFENLASHDGDFGHFQKPHRQNRSNPLNSTLDQEANFSGAPQQFAFPVKVFPAQLHSYNGDQRKHKDWHRRRRISAQKMQSSRGAPITKGQ